MDCAYCPFSYRANKVPLIQNFRKQIESMDCILQSNIFSGEAFSKLVIYGGEPLLYFKHVQRIVDEYKRQRKNSEVTFCTNGLKVDSDIIQYCIKNGITLTVNLDGDYDLVKKIKTISRGSWANLMKTLKLFRKQGIIFDFSTTITPGFIEDFKNQISFLESLSPRSIGFNFLRDKVAQKAFMIADGKEYLADAMNLVFKHNSPMNFNRTKKLEMFKSGVQSPDCVCTGSGVTISPSGRYTPCGIFPGQMHTTPRDILVQLKENYQRLFIKEPSDRVRKLPTFGGGCAKLSVVDNRNFAEQNALISFNQFVHEKL